MSTQFPNRSLPLRTLFSRELKFPFQGLFKAQRQMKTQSFSGTSTKTFAADPHQMCPCSSGCKCVFFFKFETLKADFYF